MLRLTASECALKREVQEGRDALDKMAALNSALAAEKADLNKQLLQVPALLSPAAWLKGSTSWLLFMFGRISRWRVSCRP